MSQIAGALLIAFVGVIVGMVIGPGVSRLLWRGAEFVLQILLDPFGDEDELDEGSWCPDFGHAESAHDFLGCAIMEDERRLCGCMYYRDQRKPVATPMGLGDSDNISTIEATTATGGPDA